jgi:hypothetical protein
MSPLMTNPIHALDAFLGGALGERVKEAVGRISTNILDPNTAASKARTLTIKIVFTPHKNRKSADIRMEVQTGLAGYAPVETTATIAADGDGELIMVEETDQLPGQIDMNGRENAPNVLRMGAEKE